MNLDFYSLELLARAERRDRERTAGSVRAARLAGRTAPSVRGSFLLLFRWWLHATGLLIRYPFDPQRVGAELAAAGFLTAAGRPIRSVAHVGR